MAQAKLGLLKSQATIYGLECEDEISFYEIGTGVEHICMDIANRTHGGHGNNNDKHKELSAKYNVWVYFYTNIVYLCKADGVLGEKEQEWINESRQRWYVNNDDYNNIVLNGKECINDLCESWILMHKELNPNLNDNEMNTLMIGIKRTFILASLVAASQDGLVKDEYDEITNIAIKIGLTKDDVKMCVKLIKQEVEIAKQCKDFMNPLAAQ